MKIAFLTRAQLVIMLNARLTAWNLGTPKLELFVNVPPENDLVAYGDLVAPSGTWYTAADAVPSEVYLNPDDGTLNITINSVAFNYTGASAPESVQGCALTDGSGLLYAHWMLDAPVVMGSTLSTLITPIANLRFPAIGS